MPPLENQGNISQKKHLFDYKYYMKNYIHNLFHKRRSEQFEYNHREG